MSNLKCCCGRLDCAYLEHNNAALEGLEKDVERAGQLGQALLSRHESYMAEAEQERKRMSGSIEKLEQDKRDLEAENMRMIEENRGLLDQLEDLNNATAESDAHLQSLTATLQAAQFELKRLGILASRTAQLEEQLAAMEAEQQQLQEELVSSQEDERSAVQRWKSAEGTVRNLQDQVERIENEARDEREKHVELVGRMERRRAVEKELDNAAGRLKGAAAATSLGRTKGGTSVVSHFVRDILQDNANLQVGIVELREMLHSSNEEVQNLREQILLHQPLAGDDEDAPATTSLSEEMEEKSTTSDTTPELHVHHHYHAANPSTPRKDKMPLHRRPKKKRGSMQLGNLTPSSGTQTPRTPTSHQLQRSPSSALAILSQTSVNIPQPPNTSHRWSMQSSATGSSNTLPSLPSSPQTDYRSSSIFDRIDNGFDSSRPTSPGSSIGSPQIFPTRDKRLSALSFRSTSESGYLQGQPTSAPFINSLIAPPTPSKPAINTDNPDAFPTLVEPEFELPHPTIPEEEQEDEDTPSASEETVSEETVSLSSTATLDAETRRIDDFFTSRPRASLNRSTSHESLLSISGMDIHTLQSRPSQLLLGRGGISLQSSANSPILSTTNVTVANKSTSPSTPHLLSSVAANSSSSRAPSIMSSSTSTSDGSSSAKQLTPTLSSRLGGWVWNRWGVAPSASASNLRAKAMANNANNASTVSRGSGIGSGSGFPQYEWGSGPFRAPGINTRGPIRGLRPPARTPSQVHPVAIDEEGLREAMGS